MVSEKRYWFSTAVLESSAFAVANPFTSFIDILRQQAWPKLVGLHQQFEEEESQDEEASTPAAQSASRNLTPQSSFNATDTAPPSPRPSRNRVSAIVARCLDKEQIDFDSARCTWHLLTGNQRSQRLQMEHKRHKKVARLIKRKQQRLGNLISLTLIETYSVTDPFRLRYYQGYHDVASIFLSALSGSSGPSNYRSIEGVATTMGLDLPLEVLSQISLSHLRDCMKSNFVQLQTALRLTLFPLIALLDPDVHDHLYQSEMEPVFAVPWVITWFSHEIRETDLVKRLFDAFLVCHQAMPIYVAVAMILHPYNRQEILETDPDFGMLHQTLTGLPKNSSMVGWKYRPGDGYVSDDEQGDEGTVSTRATDMANVEEAMLRLEFELDEKKTEENQIDVSLVSSLNSSTVPPVRAPFQELIDSAIGYMERVPPRKLLQLAGRYYGKDELQSLLQGAGDIALLQDPPAWALADTAKADWVLKQQSRELAGRSPTSRRDRRNQKKRAISGPESRSNDSFDSAAPKVVQPDHRSPAVIAVGLGRDKKEKRRQQRRLKLLILGAVLAAVLAVAVSLQRRKLVK